MATYKRLSASAKSARIVAPKVAESRRVTVAKSALGQVSAKSTLGRVVKKPTAVSTVGHEAVSTSAK